MAYDPGFIGGVFVAVGDVNNDGRDDIITGPDVGGGPNVHVFDGLTGNLIEDFNAYDLGTDFIGGIRVASGNVDGTGGDEIILGFGPDPRGREPLVEVFTADGSLSTPPDLIRSFDAYSPGFLGGVYVAAADIGGGVLNAPDGFADIITGAGAGGGPNVVVFNGASAVGLGVAPPMLENFFAYDPGFTGGVRVASGDVAPDVGGNPARDHVSEILTAPGTGGGPNVRAFSVDGNIATPALLILNQTAFPGNLTQGVFITGRNRGIAGEGSPLMLDSSALLGTETGTPAALTEAQLAPVVEAAFNRLSAAGVNQADLDQLRTIQFVITDLNGAVLGLETPGVIKIDPTAAGLGYFVDSTPNQDEEFSDASGYLSAIAPAAQGRVDLLTVILHELEHALGQPHATLASQSHELMAPTLLPGERRLPEQDAVFASADIFDSLLNLS